METVETIKKNLQAAQESFPLADRPLAKFFGVNFMTIYRYARIIGIRPKMTCFSGYTFDEAMRIAEYMGKPKVARHIVPGGIRIRVTVLSDDFKRLQEISQEEDLTVEALLYQIIRRYVKEHKQLF